MFNKIRNIFRKRPKTKADLVRDFAKRSGLPVVELKLSRIEPCDLKGLPLPKDQFLIASGVRETSEPLPASLAGRFVHFGPNWDDPIRKIKAGDTVLMEYATGVVETVVVTEIVDGTVYGEGDDGEPYCAPIDNCDKVPF